MTRPATPTTTPPTIAPTLTLDSTPLTATVAYPVAAAPAPVGSDVCVIDAFWPPAPS